MTPVQKRRMDRMIREERVIFKVVNEKNKSGKNFVKDYVRKFKRGRSSVKGHTDCRDTFINTRKMGRSQRLISLHNKSHSKTRS